MNYLLNDLLGTVTGCPNRGRKSRYAAKNRGFRLRLGPAVLVVILLVGFVVCPARAQPPPATNDWLGDTVEDVFNRVWTPRSRFTDGPQVRQAFRPVVAEVRRATVQIRSKGRRIAYGGIVGPDGWVLTKASLLHGELTVRLLSGKEYEARLVGMDRKYDLAMLKIDTTGLATLDLSGLTSLDLPGLTSIDLSGTKPSRSDLLVSTKGTTEIDEKKIATNSLRAGDWVATPGLGRDPAAIGVVSVAPRKIERRRGILGIRMEIHNKATRGVKIAQVFDGTGAAEAGIQAGDLLVAIDETSVANTVEVREVMKAYNPGDQIAVTVTRDKKRLRLNAILTGQVKDFRNRAQYQNNLGGKLSKRRFGFPMALQHDTVLKPNDCGGPLVDLDGRVVGFNIARSGRTESYALPTAVVKERLYDLMSGRLAPKPLSKEDKESRTGSQDD